MRKAVFSIVAKNYLPMANALGNSVKNQHPDVPFFVIVADREDGILQFSEQRYPTIPATELGIGDTDHVLLEQMAFKYNVTEFCTALKPYAFDYFLRQGYEKVIYFDPDIYVFASLDEIFNQLNTSSMVVTPHICTLQTQYTGLVPEGMLMHVGIFNFGFCAVANSENGRRVIDWWKVRLTDQCYADKIDGLHTDQKWMDFIPSLVEDLHIERGLGYNMAIWNWHERRIEVHNGQFWVSNRIDGSGLMPLVFFHFSNFHFKEAANPEQFRPKYIQKFSDLFPVGDHYAGRLADEKMSESGSKGVYSYATFENGSEITHFHRRLFRRLLESGYSFSRPFDVNDQAGFYQMLKRNSLIEKSSGAAGKVNEETYAGFEQKLLYIQRLARVLKSLLGINRYALLCKFAQRFVRPENQTFLIDEVNGKIAFYNENRYINWQMSADPKSQPESVE
ncbi:hypothetical protein DYU11_15290 [Fibrisoma montanum]|uniref:Glycosyl transferase n=1 Tax=Fibrisoma montanum TaxID=2305895 RepID=A0A418M8F8_9BACT|nr:hypothetical protein [Fibrisoma montanum]RIV22381.1 hypothetical protein DYU11_15290 [Fibrisoma montanum]